MKKSIKLLSVLLAGSLLLSGCVINKQEVVDKAQDSKAAVESSMEEKKDMAQTTEATKEKDFKAQISFSGSSTLAPVISKISTNFIEEYTTWNKVDETLLEENITIYVSAGGSGAGVKAVLDGVADFGMLARGIKDSEREKVEDLKEFTLGIDALTIAVNPDNKIIQALDGNITKDVVIKIFSGEYQKWSDIDSSLPKEDIVIVTRDLSGGAHEVFQKKIMGDIEVSKNAIQAPTMGALVSKIIENPNAIGYASYGITNQNIGKLITKVQG